MHQLRYGRALALTSAFVFAALVPTGLGHADLCPNGPAFPSDHQVQQLHKACDEFPPCGVIVAATAPLSPVFVCRRCTKGTQGREGCVSVPVRNPPATCTMNYVEKGCEMIEEAPLISIIDLDGDGEPDYNCDTFVDTGLCCHKATCLIPGPPINP